MRRKNNLGFTLIEMIVAIGCLSLVAVVTAALFTEGMNTYSGGQTAGMVTSDLRFALNHMSTIIRQARKDSVTINAAKNQVSLQVWDDGTSNYKSYTYKQVGQDIRVNDQPVCSYVQTLRFDITGREVTITITSVSSVPGSRPGSGLPITLSTRVALRNY